LAQRVAIIGAGLIGRAWAIVFARAGCDVALYDTDDEIARDALAQMRSPDERSDIRVRLADTLAAAVDGADFVQENTAETLEAKLTIFAELDKLAPRDTIL